MRRTIEETNRRRAIQASYNEEHGITPETVQSRIKDIMESVYEKDYVPALPQAAEPAAAYGQEEYADLKDLRRAIKKMEKQMYAAAQNLAFEEAARLRDAVKVLKERELQWQ